MKQKKHANKLVFKSVSLYIFIIKKMAVLDDNMGERYNMETLQVNENQLKKLATVLKNSRIRMFEYIVDEDKLVVYDDKLHVNRVVTGYIDYIDHKSKIHPDDREKVKQIYIEAKEGSVEIREFGSDGSLKRTLLELTKSKDEKTGKMILVGSSKDITEQKEHEKQLKEQATKDSLTGVYNQAYGKMLINKYLNSKNPFESCGMIILDVDYFKSVNDQYGHLFGDKVLLGLCGLLKELFYEKNNIIMRAGGDEFVIFTVNISNIELVRKNVQLMQAVRKIRFDENDCRITCSAGVCYLPENTSGYSYDQLFENADIALYKAKERGRNCYVYCDSLQHFTMMSTEHEEYEEELDARYFQNNIVETAFEIFEKTSNFDAAINLLMKVVGIRVGLDRITVIQTDIKNQEVYSDYQWNRNGIQKVLKGIGKFEKQDFLILFNGYGENGVNVLQYDDMGAYPPDVQKLLMQGDAKTVVYAAMYCEGRYTGAISYVVCKEKRNWSNEMLKQLSEVTKIISAHFAKNEIMNHAYQGVVTRMEHDTLTGLISFGRFHEEIERIILSNNTNNYLMIYTDFEDFKYFNYKYGYTVGDQLLKDFCSSIISKTTDKHNVYFTRVVSDQFILFRPARYDKEEYEQITKEIEQENLDFMFRQKERFPKSNVTLRTGVYYVTPQCMSVSVAIDAANYARQKVNNDSKCSVRFYDDEMRKRRTLENQIVNEMQEAMEQQQFKVYFQPKYSIKNQEITGAEALIRWERENGEVLSPDSFIPVYENNGKIVELDFYVFETVVKYLAENQKAGRQQVPVSINASSLHAMDPQTITIYMDILKKYDLDPALVEIELTETAVVSEYESVRELFDEFQLHGIKTAMDDFGSGYSILNTIVDIPVDVIKIDRGFITSCLESDRGIYFLKHLIDMIRNLGYQLICEGVETDQQIEILKQIGCDVIQGYWYSKPLKVEDYDELLQTEKISKKGGAISPNRQKILRDTLDNEKRK